MTRQKYLDTIRQRETTKKFRLGDSVQRRNKGQDNRSTPSTRAKKCWWKDLNGETKLNRERGNKRIFHRTGPGSRGSILTGRKKEEDPRHLQIAEEKRSINKKESAANDSATGGRRKGESDPRCVPGISGSPAGNARIVTLSTAKQKKKAERASNKEERAGRRADSLGTQRNEKQSYHRSTAWKKKCRRKDT